MTVLSIPRPRFAARARWSPETASILIPTVILLGAGLLMILSASWVSSVDAGRSPYFFLTRQALGLGVGIVLLAVCASMSIAWLKRIGRFALVVAILGLIAVLTPLGMSEDGSRRWLAFGGLTFQPSELAKLAFILVGAEICARQGARLRTVGDAIRPLGLVFLVLGALIMLQPDLGTTTIIGSLYLTLLWVAATPGRTIATMSAIGAGSFGVFAMSAEYRRARVFSFLDPFADPENTGYQAVQSIVALGSGGIFGTGPGMSRQKWLYVPNAHTDFIYAVIGEELGLFGTVGILVAFGFFAWGGYRIAQRATDPWCRLVAAGITVWIAGQAVVNVGAVTSVLPITGVPLPFVSYGNSALAVTLAAVGVLVAIARETNRQDARRAAPSA